MMNPKVTTAINGATIATLNRWLLTFTGTATNAQTVTIAGVVFTTVTSIGSTAGNVLIGASQSATCENLAEAINNPGVTNTKHVALAAADIITINNLGVTARANGATLILERNDNKTATITNSTTESNGAWTSFYVSNPIPCECQGKVSLQFLGTGVTSGSGTFTVEVSNDGINWASYTRLITNVAKTNSQTDIGAANLVINAAGTTTQIITLPETDAFAFIQVKLVAATDGTYSCFVNNA